MASLEDSPSDATDLSLFAQETTKPEFFLQETWQCEELQVTY